MAKKIVELSTKRKVELKEMSIDEMDYCSDVMTLSTNDRGESIINNMSKSRTAWIRRSVIGGDFKTFKKDDNGGIDFCEELNKGDSTDDTSDSDSDTDEGENTEDDDTIEEEEQTGEGEHIEMVRST